MALLELPVRSGLNEANFSGRSTATWGTTVTSGASNTMGSVTQLVAATSRPYNRVRVMVSNTGTSATATETSVDILIGGAGSEQAFIPKLAAGYLYSAAAVGSPTQYDFPLYVPKGSRLSAQAISVVASKAVYVQVFLWWEDGWSGQKVETLGWVAGTGRGTGVTPGTTSDGTFTSIGTTSRTWRYVTMAMQPVSTAVTAQRWTADLSRDGTNLLAGGENWDFCLNATEYVDRVSDTRPLTIPSGTTLYVRAQSHTTDATAKYVTLHGVY